MKYFKIMETGNKEFPYIVLSKSYISPLDVIDDLEVELCKLEYEGRVLVDLLLSNEFGYNRFISIGFRNNKIDIMDARVENNVSEDINKISLDYYKSNYKLLDNSVLTKKSIERVLSS